MGLRIESPLPVEIEDVATRVIGCAIAAHRALGPGYGERVYENALVIELERQGLDFTRQIPVRILYEGHTVGEGIMDVVIAGCVLLELKTVEELGKVHHAQVKAYLKATGLRLGLLINFNSAVLVDGIKRIIL